MGSAAVAIMPGEPPNVNAKKLHPFFTEPKRVSTESIASEAGEETTRDVPVAVEERDGGDEICQEGPKPKRRKKDANDDQGPEKRGRGRPRKNTKPPATSAIANHFIQLDRPDSPLCGTSETDHTRDTETESAGAPASLPLTPAPESALNIELPQSNPLEALAAPDKQTLTPRPKKLLQFNPKTGTIGSPPKPKEIKTDSKMEEKSAKPAAKENSKLLVKVKYGHDDISRQRIGRKIDAILNETPKVPSTSHKTSGATEATMQSRSGAKSTHPFFLGKAQKPATVGPVAKPTAPTTSKVTTKQFTSTPCSPKKPRNPPPSSRVPHFGGGGLGLKVPGSKLPAWPWKDAVHVHGNDSIRNDQGQTADVALSLRKSKGHVVSVDEADSVLAVAQRRLDVPAVLEEVRNTNTEEFLPPPRQLRLPEKHFESGRKLQSRVAPELRTRDPAVMHLFDSISTTLSAFDQSRCESLCWAQKYAPTCAVEVLQSGREPILLREWLKTLKVRSVDTGTTERPSSSSGKRGASKGAGGPKKKRKKNKLDGFIVSSDDEANEMDEVSDVEPADWTASGRYGITKKTVIRAGDATAMGLKEGSRLTNAIVISGPYGCGKTAAVYAVAKELDFEVFEINSSSRRAGKDVLEKIGDMTKNHLVQQHQQKAAPQGDAIISEDVSKDIISGKQATMNAFFTSKPAAKPSKTMADELQPPSAESKKTTPKDQKQSLILLEEVDNLYEEDKQFWTTVMGLITQSKRPFIMTCNDETLVPLQSLALHGIFRFTPPPSETAVDRLIAIAANEGHALRRTAVEALYDSHGRDFRATLMDLNYWCQIGVGDRRGGFDWFYLRWPKGVDVDEDGQVVRVVSEGTYQDGMGWLSRDHLLQTCLPREAEEELVQESWLNWHLDMGHWQDTSPMGAWADRTCALASTKDEQSALLDSYGRFADTMSDADIASSMAFAGGNQVGGDSLSRYELSQLTNTQVMIDATLPELSAKSRDDFIVGLPLLETPAPNHYDTLSLGVSTSLRSLARQQLRSAVEVDKTFSSAELAEMQEGSAIASIRAHLTTQPTSAPAIGRIDFSYAFDAIAAVEELLAAAHLDASIFDRNLEPIALDVAPYVRSIVAYDARLQQQRLKLSSLVSQGGRGPKRMRTTRAAMSALEGGVRSTTRKEKWFRAELNTELVARTAGRGWDEAVASVMEESSIRPSQGNTPDGRSEPSEGTDGDVDELA